MKKQGPHILLSSGFFQTIFESLFLFLLLRFSVKKSDKKCILWKISFCFEIKKIYFINDCRSFDDVWVLSRVRGPFRLREEKSRQQGFVNYFQLSISTHKLYFVFYIFDSFFLKLTGSCALSTCHISILLFKICPLLGPSKIFKGGTGPY